MGRQTSNSEREIIAQTAIERAIDTIHELDNGRWKNSCNPIIKERIINGIQPLIFAAKKANDIQQGQSESSPLDTIVRLLESNGYEIIELIGNTIQDDLEVEIDGKPEDLDNVYFQNRYEVAERVLDKLTEMLKAKEAT